MRKHKSRKHKDRSFFWMPLALLLLVGRPVTTLADYKVDIGYTLLASELGGQMPNGTGVYVTQVEALSSDMWMPNTADSQFAGKTFYDKSTEHPSGSSGHATSVGRYFYGATLSMAPGINRIDTYVAGYDDTSSYSPPPPWQWLGNGFLWAGYTVGGKPAQPVYNHPEFDCSGEKASPSRIANHSWVATTGSSSDILRRLDYVIAADEFINVVAVNNGTTNKGFLSSAFNVISVGRTDAGHPRGSVAIDSDYASGRTKPEIVSPLSLTSYTTPVVASSAALLVQVGRDPAFSDGTTTNRDGDIIQNAERSEVIKAALMAGADRFTRNTSTTANIVDYRGVAENRSDNGLDKRFGAGQVNIYNSYHIIASGEQGSDRSGSGDANWSGFDVDPAFGVSGGIPHSASYYFTSDAAHCRLAAALAWNIKINGGTCDNFNNAATRYDFNLLLYDITGGGRQLASGSSSTIENTENLWVALQKGKDYEMEVVAVNPGYNFTWDYALAWRIIADGDRDGMTDCWEIEHALNPDAPADAGGDADADSLTNFEEFEYETDPNDSDTDDDDSNDGDEETYWLSMSCSAMGCDDCVHCDIDQDGQAHNLLDPDADGDSYLDGIEIQQGTDPANPASHPSIPAVPAITAFGFISGAFMLIGLAAYRPQGGKKMTGRPILRKP